MTQTKYFNRRTEESTTRASVAMQWYRAGDSVGIAKPDPNGAGIGIKYSIIKGAPQTKQRDENLEHCKSIALDLDKYVDGMVHTCPDCGSTIDFPETVGDKFKCPHCGEVHETEDFEQLSLYDYFDGNVLDMDYLVNYQKEYKACKICVAWGGPSIYIDTESRAVELYWWGQRASYSLLSSTAEAIDEWAEEYFNCL